MTAAVLRTCAAAVLLILGRLPTAAAQDSRSVLVFYSDQALLPSALAFTDGLRESLGTPLTVRLESQHLDSPRFANAASDSALADWLRWRYRERPVRVVVTVGNPASAFASRYGDSVWPAARIVHAVVDGEQLRVASERGDPVIPRVLDYRRTLEHAMALFPAAREVWLIAGATDNDRQWMNRAVADLAPLGNRIRIKQVLGLRWDDLRDQLTTMPADTIAIAVVFFADADGRTFINADALRELARSANRPVFVLGSWLLGSGAIGGYVFDPALLGRLTGRTVLAVLNDPAAAGIPAPEGDATSWMFDAAQLRRWSISESKLPAGSLVLNRELPAWRRYLWPLVGASLLVAAQGAIIGALLVQRRTRRRVEVALRLSEEKARASYNEVRDLAGRLISAREGERTRIARDLHDDIGQRVASLSIALSRIQRQIPDVSNPARQSLSDLEQQSTQLSADLRHLSHELHPGALEHLGLLEALRERCDDFRQECGVSVQLEVSEAWRDVSDALALCLYRVAQEALRNVSTHAKAQNVTLSLEQLDGHVMMHVTDDGCGFDPTAKSRRLGLGLVSLNERVHVLGGTLDVTTARGAGTRVAVTLPTGESHAP